MITLIDKNKFHVILIFYGAYLLPLRLGLKRICSGLIKEKLTFQIWHSGIVKKQITIKKTS